MAFFSLYAVWAGAGYPVATLGTRAAGADDSSNHGGLAVMGRVAQLAADPAPALASDPRVQTLAQAVIDPWPKGGVLQYLFFTVNGPERQAADKFVADFQLTSGEVAQIKQIAIDSSKAQRALTHPSEADALAIGAREDARFLQVAGARYGAMRAWITDWFKTNTAIRTQQRLDQRVKGVR